MLFYLISFNMSSHQLQIFLYTGCLLVYDSEKTYKEIICRFTIIAYFYPKKHTF